MSAVTKDTGPTRPDNRLRVVYEHPRTGKLWPRDDRGQVLDARPCDLSTGYTAAKEHAKWIVDGTAWGAKAYVQELRWTTWHTIFCYSDS